MPRDAFPAGSPEDWLRHARADLALASVALPEDGLLELLCFHAQQAVEKCLKAVLLAQGAELIKTHDIGRLITALSPGLEPPQEVLLSTRLQLYASDTRYPGTEEEVSEREHEEAVSLAMAVVEWASRQVRPDQP